MSHRTKLLWITVGMVAFAAESMGLPAQTPDPKCVAQAAQEATRVWTPVAPAVIAKTADIPPVYTNGRIAGVVVADAWIDDGGRVQCVKITRSIPLYDAAVTASLLQWQFRTATLQGRPVAIVQSVTIPAPTSFFGAKPRSPVQMTQDGAQSADANGVAHQTASIWTPIAPAVIGKTVDIPARAGRIQGTVTADVWIDEAGKVQRVTITRSIPVYDEVVTASLLQWQFRPAMLQGHAVAVVQSVAIPAPSFPGGARPRSPAE
jgi:TonB family protein